MVVKSYSRKVQLEKKSHPSLSFAEKEREEFLPFAARRGDGGDISSKSCKVSYWASNAVKSLIAQSLTVSVLAAVGSSPAAAQFMPPPPPPADTGSPVPVQVPAAPGFQGFPASAPSSGV